MIDTKLGFALRRIAKRLWFWPAVYSALAATTVLVAVVLPPFVELPVPLDLGVDGLEKVLSILASSMLAVVTFSLSALVGALAAAAQSGTPRATMLLMEDAAVQRTLSIFVGAFLFAIVGIVGITGGIYSEAGRFLLFAVTIAVLAAVILTLIRWIDRISRLGRVGETIDKVERAAVRAFEAYARDPALGARPRRGDPPAGYPIHGTSTGYVQHLDVREFFDVAVREKVGVDLLIRPGSFVDPVRPLAVVSAPPSAELADAIRSAYTVGDSRDFVQDPRFGLVVLAEIGCRALSPAVNDPGTAIDVIGTVVRIFWRWQQADVEETAKRRDSEPVPVTIPLLDPGDMIDDALRPIARDGAGIVEVALRLTAALRSLSDIPDPAVAAVARDRLEDLLARVRASGASAADVSAVEAAATSTSVRQT